MKQRFGQPLAKFFRLWRKKTQSDSDLSPKSAQSIQQQHYLSGQETDSDVQTPPYLQVAKNLDSDEDQVFEAAVVYLYQIAREKPIWRAEIFALLEEYAQTHADRPSRVEKINEAKAFL